MVTERDRERLFWKISVLFLLASPFTVFQLARAHYSFVFNPFPFTILLFLSMPLSLVVDAVLIKLFDPHSPLRFWIVKPTDEVQYLLQLPAQEGEVVFKEMIETTHLKMFAGRIKERLTEFAFQITEEELAGSIVIAFHKQKSTPVMSFTDHSIFGEVRLGFMGSAVKVHVKTTFNDTLILESGEFERLRSLCDYLSLKSATFSYSTVPLTVYCGLNLAFTTSVVALIPYLHVGNLIITCLWTGAAGMLVASLVLMQKKQNEVLGYRLIFAGLFLSSLPLLSQLTALFRI